MKEKTKPWFQVECIEFQGRGEVVISGVDDEGTIYHGVLSPCDEGCNNEESEG